MGRWALRLEMVSTSSLSIPPESGRLGSSRRPGGAGTLGASLAQFVGHPTYSLDELHGDLEQFVFLLGGSAGRDLFGARVGQ